MVYSKNEKHFYGFFLAIPDYRLKPSSKPIITFEERAAGAPEAVKAWFYPGENYGHDFVYPKVKAMELAKANNQPEDVRFSVNFRVGSPDYYALLSGPAGRFRCAPFGIQQGDEAWQRTVSINAPELFLGHQ